jgi:transcriptional regulator with GAF, ATPase, and Fis domain
MKLKTTLTALFLSLSLINIVFAATTEAKLNIAISNIASAIEDISDSKSSVIKILVTSEYLSKELVEEIIESVATAEGIRSVGMLPISEMLELQTGTKQRFHKTYQYLDPRDSMALVNYSTKLSTVYPIIIHLVEGLDGQLWLITRDIQSTIRQHQASPKYIQEILYRAKATAKKIMNAGATGDF